MKNFFLSLKTTVWTLFVLVCLFFVGSALMPADRGLFGLMNEDLLLRWTIGPALASPLQTWWFFASLAGLVILTINTLVCSWQAIRGRWSRRDMLLRLSPQIVHVGFLFILLAHLLSAASGYKVSGSLPEGAFARLPEGRGLLLRQIDVTTDSAGYLQDWAAAVSVYENDTVVKNGSLGPNRPLFYRGTGIYLKNVSFENGPGAVLLVAKDPGAVWALLGGVLFMLGTIMLLVLKWKKAEHQ
jgi:hypothetical protein